MNLTYRLKFPLLEVGHSIDDEPRDTTSKIDNLQAVSVYSPMVNAISPTHLVEQKAHQACGNDGVTDPDVVGCP